MPATATLKPFRPEPPIVCGLAAWKWYVAFARDQIGTLVAFQEQFGSAVAIQDRIVFRRRRPQCVIVSGAEHIRQVLTDLETFQTGGFMIRGPRDSAQFRMCRGIIGTNGEEHRDMRRTVSPFFFPKAIASNFASTAELISEHLDHWEVGSTIDLDTELSRLSLLLSAKNLLAGEDLAEAARVAELSAGLLKQAYSRGVWFMPLNLPGTPFRKMLRMAEEIEQLLLKLIERRAKQNHPAENDTAQNRTENNAPEMHLLDRLIDYHRQHPDKLSLQGVVGQMIPLFAASHETVAKAVTWTMFLLSQHPQIAAELYEEITSRCGQEPPSPEAISQLPLLDAVTKETMRLLPPVPCMVRRVRREGELAGLPIRPKNYVVINAFMTHRDPEVFPEPQQFRPERWLAGGAAIDSFAYVPFSGGPRTCIGKAMGTFNINLLVAMIAQRFRLTMAPDSRVDRSFHVTLAPKHGMPMMVDLPSSRVQVSAVAGNIHDIVDLNRPDATTRPRVIPIASAIPASQRILRAA